MSRGLLQHLKNDVEELLPFSRWEDLTSQDTSYRLRSKIDIFAEKKEFAGTCDICENWVKELDKYYIQPKHLF